MPYASKYYDPVKAHEYYERTKVLKGYEDRYGGSRGNGTSAASGGYTGTKKKPTVEQQRSQAVKSYNQGISRSIADKRASTKSQIESLRNELNNMSKEDRKANRDSYRAQIKALREENNDSIQALRQQTKGGSTSGFNAKGKAAAAYIKSQMEEERESVVGEVNKAVDKQILDQVKRLQQEINERRKNGRGVSHKEFGAKIKAMLGQTKKTKTSARRKITSDYKQKYKDEIDKLRSDDSMFSYYDKKEERKRKEAEREELLERRRAEREEAAAARKSSSSSGSAKTSSKSGSKKSSKKSSKKTPPSTVEVRNGIWYKK